MKNEIRNHSHMSRETRIVQGYDFLCRWKPESSRDMIFSAGMPTSMDTRRR